MTNNQLQRYNAQQEFAVERVYQKLTEGMDDLSANEAVDGLPHGANLLKQGINQVVERIFECAEQKQAEVVYEKTDQWQSATEQVRSAVIDATLSGEYDVVEEKLKEATKATITAKESVRKMKYIKQRGQTEYDAKKDLKDYVRELEELISQDKPRLLTEEVLPRGVSWKQKS